MRVKQYLISRNIALESLNYLCEYLCLDYVKANLKCSESKIALFDEVLPTDSFQEWMRTKRNLERIEIENAKRITERITDWSDTVTDEVLAERMLNSLKFLIEKYPRYTQEQINVASKIMQSDVGYLEKILLLKQSNLFNRDEKRSSATNAVKDVKPVISIDAESEQDTGFDNNHDPYENFRWNGLSGEEAYMASLNFD